MEIFLHWLQSNLLSVFVTVFTLVLFYYYLIEKESASNLSKRYRHSIFEAQSKVFLNATQYLISGNKDLAIKEFLNAVDINRETIETYFALGGLFRSNGEIGKAISIHRSLIARDKIQESTRLRGLKELAIDFDKGGFIDKAIETYKDVLKINKDQSDVVLALCRIYEDIGEWDEAYGYRMLLSKVSRDNQSETISHILVQKAKKKFQYGQIRECLDDLESAFQFSPSVSAKILKLKINLATGKIDEAKNILIELLHENSIYTSFVFESLNENINSTKETNEIYLLKLNLLKDYFLKFDDAEVMKSPAVILTKMRILIEKNTFDRAYLFVKQWMDTSNNVTETLRVEFIKLAIRLDKKDEAIESMGIYLENINRSLTKHYCSNCGYNSDEIFWRCPQCHEWETIKFRWKI